MRNSPRDRALAAMTPETREIFERLEFCSDGDRECVLNGHDALLLQTLIISTIEMAQRLDRWIEEAMKYEDA